MERTAARKKATVHEPEGERESTGAPEPARPKRRAQTRDVDAGEDEDDMYV